MKQIKYILTSLVLLFPVLAHAATDNPPIYSNYKVENGVATAKSVSASDENNVYTLTLETFATGVKTIVKTYTPVDVILVLDISNSMTEYNYSYYDEDQGRQVTGTRLAALKYAVGKFVDEIARNDGFDDDGNRRVDADGNETVLGNRIQVVTFNSSASARFSAFQPAFANQQTIKTNVNNITEDRGTRTDSGLETGLTWVRNSISQKPNSNRVVVMFTDGCPSTSGPTNFTASYAISAVNNAYTIKNTTSYNGVTSNTGVATVYSIGLIDWNALSTDNQTYVRNMMDYISSNYPNGQASSTNTFTCTGTRVADTFNFYVDANETDLGEIFKSIAVASGGSENTIPGETQLVDEVSSSFEVPSDFEASDVVVYYRTINADGTQWVGSAATTSLTKVILPDNYDLTQLPPENIAAQIADENTVGVYLKDGKLVILGFNYSKIDGDDEDGSTEHPYTGNWVGWRTNSSNNTVCAGKELVIEFNVNAINGVTGGDNTNTNKSTSGVYIPTYDEDGNFTGYTNATYYPYPDTDLPIRLVIEKDGLRHGESATIQIYRAPQKAGSYDANTGKPAPDLTNGWENFTKVILTNKGEDFDTVTKILLSLDPSYVYKLEEDDWGWGYKLDTKTYDTSSKESNPFTFTNTLKTTDAEGNPIVKHAEAVSINHFGTGAHADTYKSSKTNYFNSTNSTE